jgi:membrane protease subunit (stomatin/prohibitin family)
MSETIDRARRSLELELKRHQEQAEKIRRALAAMNALNGRATGKRNMSKKHLIECGCGTKFHSVRSDARYCSECKKKRNRERMRVGRPKKSRGTVLVKGAK